MSTEETTKLVISIKRKDKWLEEKANCLNEIYNQLSGKLLTTLEIALPTGRQLEALKERTKDIQGEFSNVMDQGSYSIFVHQFVASDEIQDKKPSEKDYRAKVEYYWSLLEDHITGKFNGFRSRILNLVTIAVEEHERQEALREEVRKIIDDSSLKLRSWLGKGIHGTLLGIKE